MLSSSNECEYVNVILSITPYLENMAASKPQKILLLRHGYAGFASQTSGAFGIAEKHVAIDEGKHVSQIGQVLSKLVIAYVKRTLLEDDVSFERVIQSSLERSQETAEHMFPEHLAEVDKRVRPYIARDVQLHCEELSALLKELREDGRNTAVITHDQIPCVTAFLASGEQKTLSATDAEETMDDGQEKMQLFQEQHMLGLPEARNSGGVLLHYEGNGVIITHIHPPTIIKQLLQEAVAILPSEPPSPFAAPLMGIANNSDKHGFENFSPLRGLVSDDFRALKGLSERLNKRESVPEQGLLSDQSIREPFSEFLKLTVEMGRASCAAITERSQ